MAYTGSKAGIGSLTQISIYTSPGTYVPIYEIVDFNQTGQKLSLADVTNLNSPAKEIIGTLIESGEYTLTYNRVPSDPGQAALEAAFAAKALTTFNAQMVDGDQFVFTAYVSAFDPLSSVSPMKAIQSKATLTISGLLEYAGILGASTAGTTGTSGSAGYGGSGIYGVTA